MQWGNRETEINTLVLDCNDQGSMNGMDMIFTPCVTTLGSLLVTQVLFPGNIIIIKEVSTHLKYYVIWKSQVVGVLQRDVLNFLQLIIHRMCLSFLFQTIMCKIIRSPKEQNHPTLYIVRKCDGKRSSQTNDQESGERHISLQATQWKVSCSWVTNLDKGGMLAVLLIPFQKPCVLLPAPCLWD